MKSWSRHRKWALVGVAFGYYLPTEGSSASRLPPSSAVAGVRDPREQVARRLTRDCAAGNPKDPNRPVLCELKVSGQLPSKASRVLPLVPPLDLEGKTQHENYHCWLDYAMDTFTLSVQALAPGVLSKVTLDGVGMPSRINLTNIDLPPGDKKTFTIAVQIMETRTYTLIVERRAGGTTELLALEPITGKLGVPYNPGELQEHFEVNQTFYENYFELEYVKADGGQRVSCAVDGAATYGVASAPSGGEIAAHPQKYMPSLEELHNETLTEQYDPRRGPIALCKAPIDTWRQIALILQVVSADGSSQRQIRLVVTRAGCPMGKFYYHGHCLQWCPSFTYEQQFNWRCGQCNSNCEFCLHWANCTKCQPDTSMKRYRLRDDGTCEAFRIHAYKVYYDLVWYLAICCSVLLSIYVLACVITMCRRTFCAQAEEDEESMETIRLLNTKDSRERGKLRGTSRFAPAE